ncbi:hypothetical protein [Rhizobium leguminosarum]|nr:hypothetical protein [Rhizobium leguminosarum]
MSSRKAASCGNNRWLGWFARNGKRPIVFHEILAELALLTNPADGDTFHFSVEYLTRRKVCFQFIGRRGDGLAEMDGYHIEASLGGVTALPGHLWWRPSSIGYNSLIKFYSPSKLSVGAIANEVWQGIRTPDIANSDGWHYLY